MPDATIWTIGHSNRSKQEFLDLLKEHKIQVLADVRSFPKSKIEHFKREEMKKWLPENGVEYTWLGDLLGGYRRGGYITWTRTSAYRPGIRKLVELARRKKVCICCMETDARYCHRHFISRTLEEEGVKVIHIMKKGQTHLTL